MKKVLATIAIASTAILSIACVSTETVEIETPVVAPVVEVIEENATIEMWTMEVPTCTNGNVTVEGTEYTTIATLDFRMSGNIPNELVTLGVSGISNAVQEVSCETGELTRVGWEGLAWNFIELTSKRDVNVVINSSKQDRTKKE